MSWQAFESARQQILELNPQAIARTQELGSQLAFDLASRRLADLQRILQEIDEGVGKLIPDQTWLEARDILIQITNYVSMIHSFQINQENAYAQKSGLEAQFEGAYAAAVRILTTPLVISNSLGSGSSLSAELASIKRDAESAVSSSINAAVGTISETREQLEAARETAKNDAESLSQLLEEVRASGRDCVNKSC